MNPGTLFDHAEARALAESGAQAAAEHADRKHDGWQDQAFALFMRYAREHSPFQTEQARLWAYGEGLPLPPDGRAWGHIVKRAMRAGLRQDGFGPTRNRTGHGRPMILWKLSIPQN